MKRIIAMLLALVLTVGLCACGNTTTIKIDGIDYGETEHKENKTIVLDNPIVILDNEYVKMEIIKIYQEYKDYLNAEPEVEKSISLKTTNKTDYDLRISLSDGYIGPDPINFVFYYGLITPKAKKNAINDISFYRPVGQNREPLESLDEIYNIEGTIEISKYIGENSLSVLGEYDFKIAK